MPCNYKEYHPKWSLISKLIRENRASNHCEWCGLKNYAVIKRLKGGGFVPATDLQLDEINFVAIRYGLSYQTALQKIGYTRVVLTVAHVNHDKTINRFSNLAALCQACHLKHDVRQHIANRKYGRNHKGKHQIKLEL